MSNKENLKNKIENKQRRPITTFLDNFESGKEEEDKKNVPGKTEPKSGNTSNKNKPENKTKPLSQKLNTNTEEHPQNMEEEEAKYFWEKIKSGSVEKRNKVFTSFYLDPDLNDIIEEIITVNTKKGVKSQLINQSIRDSFKQQGLL